MNPGKFYLPIEVADRFRYSVSFIYFLVRRKKLRAVKIGRKVRIPQKEICRFFCQGEGECDSCPFREKYKNHGN